MRYQTYIAAVILGISPVAAFAAEADQQQPYATPQASDSEQNSSNTTTGDQQSDTYSAGEEGKHKTGQASSANKSEARSNQNAATQSGTNGASPEAKRKTGQSSSAQESKASSGQSEQSMSEPSDSDQESSASDQDEDSGGTSDTPKRLVIVVPEEMQDTMEQLIAFLKASPDAEILIMAPGESAADENTFRLQSGGSSDEDEDQ